MSYCMTFSTVRPSVPFKQTQTPDPAILKFGFAHGSKPLVKLSFKRRTNELNIFLHIFLKRLTYLEEFYPIHGDNPYRIQWHYKCHNHQNEHNMVHLADLYLNVSQMNILPVTGKHTESIKYIYYIFFKYRDFRAVDK